MLVRLHAGTWCDAPAAGKRTRCVAAGVIDFRRTSITCPQRRNKVSPHTEAREMHHVRRRFESPPRVDFLVPAHRLWGVRKHCRATQSSRDDFFATRKGLKNRGLRPRLARPIDRPCLAKKSPRGLLQQKLTAQCRPPMPHSAAPPDAELFESIYQNLAVHHARVA
jgi:hypothetical protein